METGTSLVWPREIGRNRTGSDVTYELPVRPLGSSRWLGLVLVGFSVLFVWDPVRESARELARWRAGEPVGMDQVVVLFLVPFVALGLVPATVGLFMAFGRSRVSWRAGQLRSTEILGPLRWTRRFPAGSVQRLEIGIPPDDDGKPAVAEGPLGGFGSMRVHVRGHRPRRVAINYPLR